jgi:hypothetical protein
MSRVVHIVWIEHLPFCGSNHRELRKQAEEFAVATYQGRTITQHETAWQVEISKKGIRKASSGNRAMLEVHLAVLWALETLIAQAWLGYSHPDRAQNPDIYSVHRCFAALGIRSLGVVYSVNLR